MRCSLGVAAVALGLAAVSGQTGEEPPGASLKPLDRGTVRRALDLALATLASPGCPQVYADFALPEGGTPRDALERLGIGPEELLETLVFIDGSREPVCRMGLAVLTTTPGSRVVSVCPGFAQFQIKNPGKSASVMIHESLHALGLGENPPSSNEITQRVERRCWRAAKRARAKPGRPDDQTAAFSSPGWSVDRAFPGAARVKLSGLPRPRTMKERAPMLPGMIPRSPRPARTAPLRVTSTSTP